MLVAMRNAALLLLLLPAACASGPLLHVAEEHHQVWPAWEEARAAGGLPPGAVLVHLDAHADLGAPDDWDDFPADIGPEEARRLVREEVSIADFILPAARAGTVVRMVWVVPPWLPPRFRRVPEDCGLEVEIREPEDLPLLSGPVILDVDLDYFACENPHVAHTDREIDRAEYERLLAEGRVRMQGEAREGEEVTHSIVLERPPGPFTWPVRLDRIRNLRTGEERFVRGHICMGLYRDAFPVRRPSEAEMERLLAVTEEALRRSVPTPAVVTIGRSATSGFVLPSRVDAIEAAVIAMLERVYPGLRR
jgi:hypothetical protein